MLNWCLRRLADGACIGAVQATVEPARRRALVAYLLVARAQGQGYAREALAAAVRHLFDDHRVESVDALIDTRNRRSIRLVESLGFRQIELLENADHFKGADSDEYRYRLTPA